MGQAALKTASPPGQAITLKSVRSGKRKEPDKLLLVGTEGVGKSTFSSEAPSPIFIAAEDGVAHLDVTSFPEPETFNDVLRMIRLLRDESHDYRTLVVDTVDWLEPLIWQQVCADNDWENIESPGYGKGYAVATNTWRELVAELERLRRSKAMEIHLLAHADISTFSNPAGDDYSRYQCKLNKKAAAIMREWVNANLFAVHEEFAAKLKKGDLKSKGVSTGRRVIHTERCAAWDAKNRYNLPPTLPLSYADYAAARELGQVADPAKLKAEAVELLDELAPDTDKRQAIQSSIDGASNNATKLAKVVDRLRTLVSEKED